MNALVAASFADELEKIGQSAPLSLMHRLGKAIWSSGAGRAAVGAVPGALVGYATAPPEERVRRAILGGAAGAAGGFVSPLATKAGRQAFKDWTKRYVQEQKHQFTGLGQMPRKPGMSPKELAELQAAEEAGITSIPGLARGLIRQPRKTVGEAWRQAGRMGKGMAIADVALTGKSVMDPNTEEGMGEKALGGVGSAGGYLLASRMGMIPAMLVGGGLGKATGMLGRGIDVLTGERQKKLRAKSQKMSQRAEELLAGGRPSTHYLREQAIQAL